MAHSGRRKENEYETSVINGDFETGPPLPLNGPDRLVRGRFRHWHLSILWRRKQQQMREVETLKDSANGLWLLNGGVPVVGDTEYEFTGYYKCLNTATTGARVSIRTLDANGINPIIYTQICPTQPPESFSFKFKTHPDRKNPILVRLHGKAGQATYDSVGLVDSTVEAESYSYTGKNIDKSTQLVYFGARYYDPEVGRFITGDPKNSSFKIYSPQTYNRYVYC